MSLAWLLANVSYGFETQMDSFVFEFFKNSAAALPSFARQRVETRFDSVEVTVADNVAVERICRCPIAALP